MKKLLAVLLTGLMLVSILVLPGCSDSDSDSDSKAESKYKTSMPEQEPSENLDILIAGDWYYDGDDCYDQIYFGEDGSFSNYCSASGNPIGDADLAEYFVYDDETGKIYVYGPDKKYFDEGTIKVINENEIEVSLFDHNTYLNANAESDEYEEE